MSFVIREFKIKTMRFYFISLKMTKIQTLTIPSFGKDAGPWVFSFIPGIAK